MKVFTDGTDTIVANDLDGLRDFWEECGNDADDFVADDWKELDQASTKTIWCDPKSGLPDEPGEPNAKVTRTIAEWAQLCGIGLLCSTEF